MRTTTKNTLLTRGVEFLSCSWWRHTMVVVSLTVLANAASVLAASAAQRITQHTLANGLQVVLVEDHWHPIVALEVCYRVGARNDPPGKQGLAHLSWLKT